MKLTLLGQGEAAPIATKIAHEFSIRHDVTVVVSDAPALSANAVCVDVPSAAVDAVVGVMAAAAPARVCLLVDQVTTVEEAEALIRLWEAPREPAVHRSVVELVDRSGAPEEADVSPGLIVGARGLRVALGQSTPPAADAMWFGDRCQALLPGPVLTARAILSQGWPSVGAPVTAWITQCAQLSPFIHLRTTDTRSSVPVEWDDPMKVSYAALAQRGRPRTNWADANRQLIPAAEARSAALPFPPGKEHVVVVGVQRSGTTWLTRSLAGLEGACALNEEMALDVLIDGFPAPAVEAPLMAWHATFLAPCPNLLRDVAARARLLVIIRNPADVVWSLLTHFDGLSDVATLTSLLHGDVLGASATDRAVALVRIAWETLASVIEQHASSSLVVRYEDLQSEPARTLSAIGSWLDRRTVTLPDSSDAAARRKRPLDPSTLARVDDILRPLYERLMRFGTPSPSTEFPTPTR